LATKHGPAYATGTRISTSRNGVVTVHGWFATATGHRIRRASFRFVPAGDCVTLSFALNRGERVGYSAFVRRIGTKSRTGVAGGGERVNIAPAAHAVHVDGSPYSSGSDATLERVRFALSAPGRTRITTCSDR
jgi:hypothetical protein